VDVGSLRTPAAVAWLDRGRFVLDAYVPSAASPLPDEPGGMPAATCFALDAPQSLPELGSTRRAADREAQTPTSVLPDRLADVPAMRAYGPFVEAGLAIFWAANSLGLPVVETYPRFVIRTLWPELKVPSKRKEPKRYVAELWSLIRALGYSSRPPGTDHEIDAMLCAVAAEAFAAGTHLQVGAPRTVDETEGVLREGYIVVPRPVRSPEAGELGRLQDESYAQAGTAIGGSWPRDQAMDEDELAAFLEERLYCVLATASPAGRAQARPVGFTLFGGALWFASVAGSRLRNLERLGWASAVVAEGEGDVHRAIAADGPVEIHDRPPTGLLARWEQRFGSEPDWVAAWLELRPERLFSYAGGAFRE
jgi:predicted nuclease with RNAse H fold